MNLQDSRDMGCTIEMGKIPMLGINDRLWMRRPCLFSFQAVISSLTYWSFQKNLNFPVKITIGMFTWGLFTQNQLVTWFDVNVPWQPHRPGGSAPYGRTSVPVQLHRSREAAGSPSHSVAATWLHLGTQQFHIWYAKIFSQKCKIMGIVENLLQARVNRSSPPERKVSKMICAPL